jgi:hypothetical protein
MKRRALMKLILKCLDDADVDFDSGTVTIKDARRVVKAAFSEDLLERERERGKGGLISTPPVAVNGSGNVSFTDPDSFTGPDITISAYYDDSDPWLARLHKIAAAISPAYAEWEIVACAGIDLKRPPVEVLDPDDNWSVYRHFKAGPLLTIDIGTITLRVPEAEGATV